MKKCPYCAEEIQAEAIKCEHCGEEVAEAGVVTHYFDRIHTCVIKISKGSIRIGDKLVIVGAKERFVQKVISMQIESRDVKVANQGQLIGLIVDKMVREGDKVYKSSLAGSIRTCQYCSEEIQDEAIKCKHCGEFLLEGDKNESEASSLKSVNTIENDEEVGVPKCPTCRSKEVKKITAGDRLSTMFLFGRLDNLIKSFKCNKCGHRW